MANHLAGETSPYLRQHAGNPVDWYPWGAEAFARARDLDLPIMLSVGYSACHWCHVMAHESFEDPAIASLMNRLFVNVKVDREERPDVDAIYMRAVQAMTGQGGWPMTVFLTPDQTPFFGGTYFPPRDRHGLRGFPVVLQAAHDAYRNRRDDVERAGAQLKQALELPRIAGGGDPDPAQLSTATAQLLEQSDPRGGFGGAPKFPHPGAVELLLRAWAAGRNPGAADAVVTNLDAMARGGIYDQLGGGFHRYSVDAAWAVPHFEKMLYDNAQLAAVYLHAYQFAGEQRWRVVVEETLDYLVREMLLPGGGFASSQDADTEGEEGRFFVWTPEQVTAVLGPEDAALACGVFGITEQGNFEAGATVLSRQASLDEVAPESSTDPNRIEERVRSIRGRLLEARGRRVAPGRDDKAITSWNALAARAFAEAGATLGRPDYVEVARNSVDFLLRDLVRDGMVLRTWRGGEAKITGFLEDVAYLGDALLAVYEATGEAAYFARAAVLAEDMLRRFQDAEGGWFDTATDAEPLLVRPRSLEDSPIPAGQSMAAQFYLRLAAFTGVETWRERALDIIRPLGAAIARAPLAVSNLACALDLALAPPREIAIVGERGDLGMAALLGVVRRRYDPYRVLAWGDAATVPLLAGRPMLERRATAYVCERFACQAPVTEPEALLHQLERVAAPA